MKKIRRALISQKYLQFRKRFILKAFRRSGMILREMLVKAHIYSIDYAIYSTAWWIGWYISSHIPIFKNLCMWGFIHKDKFIKKYLQTKYYSIISEYKNNTGIQEVYIKSENYPIWVFWYQGITYAPQMVKACFINLKRKNSNIHQIDKNNIESYINIPIYIKEKVDKGIISLTHYSDIIRVSLLAKYGGIWIDSTCFTSKEMPKEYKNMPFYSSKTITNHSLPLWSNSRWCGWGMGSCFKNYPLFCFLRDMLFAYWKRETHLIDYLLLDALIEIGFNNNKLIHTDMKNLPENNLRRNELWFLMNKPFSKKQYEQIISDTWLFKLSYKTVLTDISKNGEKTYYYHLLNQELN